jgi:hypothetical protein
MLKSILGTDDGAELGVALTISLRLLSPPPLMPKDLLIQSTVISVISLIEKDWNSIVILSKYF